MRGGVLVKKLSGLLPLQGLLICLLIGSTFPVALMSADPWWRPKEWSVFIIGCLWVALRPVLQRQQGISPKALYLFVPFMVWILAQTIFLFVVPIIMAKGAYSTIPWVWFAFLNLLLIWVWFQDVCANLKPDNFKLIWKVIGSIGGGLAVLMLLQAVGLDPLLFLIRYFYGEATWLSDNHVVGLMGNPFQAGACLAIMVPILVALQWWVAVLLAFLALFFTNSTSSIIAALAGSLAVLYLTGQKRTCFIASVATLLVSLRLLSTDFFSFSGRMPLWSKSIVLWNQRFLWKGSGLGTYKLLGITAQSMSPEAPNAVRWAHNEWIQLGMETGLIGLILFFLALFILFIRLRKGRSCSRTPEALGVLATGFVLSVCSIPFHLAPTVVVLLIALAAALVHLKELERT